MFFLALALALASQGQPIAQPHLALVDANVIDVRTGDVTTGATVVLQGGKIVSIGAAAPPSGAETIERAHAMGIPIVTGADTSYGPESVVRITIEMVNFVKLGMTPLEAIRSATLVATEMLGISDRTGVLDVGMEADILVVSGNPLEDIRAVQDVIVVVSNGRVGLNRLPFAKN